MHAADLIRVCATTFGVWKLVSTKKSDLSRFCALYNPFLIDMKASFQIRLLRVEKLMATPDCHAKWVEATRQVNSSIQRRNMSIKWKRCPDACIGAHLKPYLGEGFPLASWGIHLLKE
jgi:hypothetical protein